MKGRVLETNTAAYFVARKEDGSLFISRDGVESIVNAGSFIVNFGGVDALWGRLADKEELTAEEFGVLVRQRAQAKKERQEAGFNEAVRRREDRRAELEAEVKALLADNGGVIPSTPDNVATVLHYLNTMNWGGWDLPKMSIGYTANQYDCDGRQATTMSLDVPINMAEYFGMDDDTCLVSKFQTGAPHGHLGKYHRL